MNTILKRVMLVGVFICFSVFAGDETLDASAKGILDESVKLAVEGDFGLQATEAKRESAKEGVLQAEAARWPTIGLVASAGTTFSHKKNVTRAQPAGRTSSARRSIGHSASVGVELSQVLYSGGQIDAKIESAKLEDLLQGIQYEGAKSNSVFTTIRAVLTVLETRALLRVAQRGKELLEQKTENMQVRADYGLESVTALESTRAEAESAKAKFLSQKTAVELAEKEYEVLTGQKPPAALEDIEPVQLPESFELIQEAVFSQSYDMQQKKLASDRAEQDVLVAEGALGPTLSLSMSGNHGLSSTHGASTPGKIDWSRTNSFNVGLNLKIPLDYTGAAHSAVRSRKYVQAHARLDEKNMRQLLGLKTFKIWKEYKAAQSNLERYKAQVKAADLSLEAVQEQYNAGTLGYLDVLQAIARAAEANTNYIQNKKLSLERGYELLHFMGALSKAFNLDGNKEAASNGAEVPYWDTRLEKYDGVGWERDPNFGKIKIKTGTE